MAVLTRDAILGRVDIARGKVECPEWGGSLTVRGLTLAERNSLVDCDDTTAPLRAIVMCAIDPKTGNRIFEAEDEETLGQKNPEVIDRLARKIMELSGLRKPDAEVEKN